MLRRGHRFLIDRARTGIMGLGPGIRWTWISRAVAFVMPLTTGRLSPEPTVRNWDLH